MNMNDYLNWLEARDGHAAAICMSAADWGDMKMKLELACKMLGKRCKYQITP
jgi:hypothetical protein